MSAQAASGVKGTPLALFALVMAGWVGARVMLWESPVPPAPIVARALQPAAPPLQDAPPVSRLPPALPRQQLRAADLFVLAARPAAAARSPQRPARPPAARPAAAIPRLDRPDRLPALAAPPGVSPQRPAPASPFAQSAPQRAERWSLDAWAFFRQGSDAAPISQGRVPIYGASQIGAIAQLRLAPASRHDPRVYVRGYRALVARGETEGALGGSIRPIVSLPLRAFAEVRYTDTPFTRELRPSLFIVSELPPQPLPAGFTLEAYGQAGWVGGSFATPFADGQVSLARELARLNGPGGVPLRISAGAGAWGGAQRDAQRLDIGPTLRVEWTMGRVPARFSIDWRAQVAGDAAPESGLAATLSTSF